MNDALGEFAWTDGADEDGTVHLLRIAGPRQAVPATRAARVRAAVHAEWQTGSRRRARRQRVRLASMVLAAAAAIALIVGRTVVDRAPATSGELVAVVEQVAGTSHLAPKAPIRAGESIETDARTRLALRFSDGTSVRLDAGSRARALSASVLELASGAVYVDNGREPGGFEVRTPVATARDIGTQFEVRLFGRALRLRVRSGIVELKDDVRSVSGRAGTEVMFSATGAISRPITSHGAEWDWIAGVASPLDIEGMALSAFLERIAREHGWTLNYADAALAREASGVILHGSVTGLSPQEAIDVAITTSGLRHSLQNGELAVTRGSAER